MANPTTKKPKMPIVQVSVTETEKAQIDQQAKDLGLSTSAYCRTVLNQYSTSYYRSQKAQLKK